MKNCPTDAELNSMLQEAIEGDLLQAISAHVDDCSLCQSRLDDMTDAGDLVAAESDLSSMPKLVTEQLRETPRTHLSDTVEDFTGDSGFGHTDFSIAGFEIVAHIASGGTGALYRATDKTLNRLVAVKVMHERLARNQSARTRLLKEARAVAAIDHSNVVTVHSVGEDSLNRPYMAMQLISGNSISRRLSQRGFFSAGEAARLVEQAANGLAAAHAAGLIHRDVKSSNILIDDSTRSAIVVDFGLVREDDQETQLTMDGMLAGTPAYISPEQIADPTGVDARTDVYSLGIVFYEMLTGLVPFRGVLRMTLQQVEHSEPQPPRELNDTIPIDLQTICLKAIEKDPARRYQSADEFAADLRRWQNKEPIHARPVTSIEQAWRWCQRNTRVAVLSALVAFALAAAVGITAASAWRISLANEAVQESDNIARKNADALVLQRNAAMETMRRLVFDVTQQLSDVPADTVDVRKDILQIALEGLEKIGRSAESSGEFDLSMAQALQQFGSALIDAGETDDGEHQLLRAQKLINGMTDSADQAVLAQVQQSISIDLADISYERGETSRERQHLETAVAAARRWADVAPEDSAAQVTLGSTLNLLAEFEASEDNAEKSSQLFEESTSLLTSVLDSDPDNIDAEMELGVAEVGMLPPDEIEVSPEEEALRKQLLSQLRSARDQHKTAPEKDSNRLALADACLKLAEWHAVFGNGNQADKLCENAESLLSLESSADEFLLRVRSQRIAADVNYEYGELKAGRNGYRRCLSTMESELAEIRDLPETRIEFLKCQIGLGNCYADQGNGRKALPCFESVLATLTTDEQSAELPLPARSTFETAAYTGLAWSHFSEGNDAKASTCLQKAVAALGNWAEGSADLYQRRQFENLQGEISSLKSELPDAAD